MSRRHPRPWRVVAEQTIVELLPLEELRATLRAGGIDHALVVAALYCFELWRASRT